MEKRAKSYNKLLKKYFGYDELKKQQIDIIDQIVHCKKDVCAVLATGFGKSICFQIPFLAMDKCIIVISPLIALIEDQRKHMEKLGIPVCSMDSTNLNKEEDQFDILDGQNKIIYITPETLLTQEHFIRKLFNIDRLGLVAVDEAHCVSSWGLDFRTAYTKLHVIKGWAPSVPILAVTATATEKVQKDIYKFLNLQNPYHIVGSFYRDNLNLNVRLKTEDINTDIVDLVKSFNGKYVIVYCKTRDDTIKVAKLIDDSGISCYAYHAGQKSSDRTKYQTEFMEGTIKCIVATIAFGMGINVPNIRYVVHYSSPKNIESYYQEVGRAGRDGKKSDCYLFYSNKDFVVNKIFLQKIKNQSFKTYQEGQVQQMEKYIYQTQCRWKTLLEHFDEDIDDCGHCDNCCKSTNVESRDFTEQAKLIIQVIKYINGKYGSGTIINILRGSDNKKLSPHLKKWSVFGKGKEYSDKYWKALLRMMINVEFIKEKSVTGGFGSVIEHTNEGLKWYNDDTTLKLELTEDFKNVENRQKNKVSKPREIKIKEDDTNFDYKNMVKLIEKTKLNETYLKTYMLYDDNKSIADITTERNLQKTTIENHLVQCFSSGLDIDLYKLGLIQSNLKLINETIKNMSIDYEKPELKKIKDKLPFNVSYLHIKLGLVVIKNKWEHKLNKNNIKVIE
jgi:Werner syndrome ATP-dependent helicase